MLFQIVDVSVDVIRKIFSRKGSKWRDSFKNGNRLVFYQVHHDIIIWNDHKHVDYFYPRNTSFGKILNIMKYTVSNFMRKRVNNPSVEVYTFHFLNPKTKMRKLFILF